MKSATDFEALAGELATMDELMTAAGVQFSDRDAYVEVGRRLSFQDWMRFSDALATELIHLGVAKGDVVAIVLPSSIDYAICYAAIIKTGAIATGLNIRLGRKEIESIMLQSSPAVVIWDEALKASAHFGGSRVLRRSELPQIYKRSITEPVLGMCQPDDLIAIIWTSGTTGQPKGACFDHRNLRAVYEGGGVTTASGDRRLVSTPFAHAGYMGKVWGQLVLGITDVISPPRWSAETMLEQILAEEITLVGGVPTQWEKLLMLSGIREADLSLVRLGVTSTAPARPELVEAVKEQLGFPLIVRYAMTESPAICGTNPEDSPEVQFRTVGRPQRGMEVSVLADDGDIGQVRIRGGCVMRGYWNAPELTERMFDEDGWLISGDLGFLRSDGNLAVVGRADDMYIRGGYNVYPAEVEIVLATHPGVQAVSVVGVPAPTIGEIGVAFVVPADSSAPPALEELRDLVRAELSDYKAPDRLELLQELPTTSMLKVSKSALRELAVRPK